MDQQRSALVKHIIIFQYKRFESVKCLQDAFGTTDINHTYSLHRWNSLKSLHKRCDRWLNFIVIHDLDFIFVTI